jgi:hypothetical protein
MKGCKQMNHYAYVPHYPRYTYYPTYPYQPYHDHRNYYPVNPYYTYTPYFDYRYYSAPIYPINKTDSHLKTRYPFDRQGLISLQNNANTQWKDWYLDIDGETGDVILWPRLGSGGYWKLTDHGNGTVSLQNNANTQWKDWYLDIDGETGDVILWPRLGSGGYWKLTDHGNGTVSLQNNANTQWKDWYLDIDGETGDVILWPRLGSGGYWKFTDHGNGTDGPPPPDELEPGVHRNLIRRISYDEPYSETCYKNVGGVQVPYPCFGMKTKVIEIYLETRYPPEATPEQKAAIIACAGTAASVAYGSFLTAYTATTAATAGVGGILAGVAAGIAAAETAGRASFDECKRRSLPHDIASRTGMSIVQEKFDR